MERAGTSGVVAHLARVDGLDDAWYPARATPGLRSLALGLQRGSQCPQKRRAAIDVAAWPLRPGQVTAFADGRRGARDRKFLAHSARRTQPVRVVPLVPGADLAGRQRIRRGRARVSQ